MLRLLGAKGSRDHARNAGEKARRRPSCCFGATPLGGERPRSNGQTTAWPSAPSRGQWLRVEVNAGARKSIKLNQRRRRRRPLHRAACSRGPAETNKPKLRRARFFGTHVAKG